MVLDINTPVLETAVHVSILAAVRIDNCTYVMVMLVKKLVHSNIYWKKKVSIVSPRISQQNMALRKHLSSKYMECHIIIIFFFLYF